MSSKAGEVLEARRLAVMRDRKWFKFRHRAKIFRQIPFVEFVLAGGSMAMGTAKENSDFDVLVCARKGRIFTVRMLAVLFFGVRGWRRRKSTTERQARDKICLNHFITDEVDISSWPQNEYSQRLYKSWIPLYGERDKINPWKERFGGEGFIDDKRYNKDEKGGLAVVLERLLAGKWGDKGEDFFRRIQAVKIERGQKGEELPSGARFIFTDQEMEFHPEVKEKVNLS